MNSNFIITEEQKKLIINESIGSELGGIVKENYEFVKDILKKASEQIGVNLEFAITWGATIGGLVGPLNDFVMGVSPEINDVELSLLLTGVIAVIYFDNKKLITTILEKIKENGLEDIFKTTLKKGEELKNVFLTFIESLNLTTHKIINIMSYTFIVPLIPQLFELGHNGTFTDSDISQISVRLASFGVLTVSSLIIRELVNKMLQRFKN
jgi:hypothetical protein